MTVLELKQRNYAIIANGLQAEGRPIEYITEVLAGFDAFDSNPIEAEILNQVCKVYL